MKNLPSFAANPQLWDDMDPYFTELMEEAEFAKMTWEEQEAYIASMKQKWDYQNTLDFAEMKGREAGMEDGLKKGREEGREAERISTARRMLEKQYTAEAIAELTGLTEEQVRAL